MKRATRITKPDADLLPILCELLGILDAIYWPIRFGHANDIRAAHRLRESYPVSGIRWTNSQSATMRGYKADQRTRERLAESGAVQLIKAGGSFPAIRFTERGEDFLRSFLNLATLADALPLYTRLRTLEDNGDPAVKESREFRIWPFGVASSDGIRVWFAETVVFQTNRIETPRLIDWCDYEACILPLLVCGLVESLSSTILHIYYGAHRSKLDAVIERIRQAPKVKTKASEELKKIYYDSFWTRADQLLTEEPTDPAEISPIPLPATW